MVRSETAGSLVAQSTATPESTPTPTPTPVPGSEAASRLVSEWLPVTGSVEEKLAVSAGLLVIVLLVSWVVVPWSLERLHRACERRLTTDRVDAQLERIEAALPFAVTTYYLVRIAQTILVGAAVLVLFVVWGLADVTVTTLAVLRELWPQIVKVIQSILLVGGAYVGVGLIEGFVDRIAQQSGQLDEHQGEIVFRVLQVVLLTSAGLVALTIWGVEPSGLLVGAGFLGIVVGMAARQTLGQLLAGFVLMFSKPFEVGHWIEVDGQEGVVTDITIVNTRLENFDGEYVVMPNDVISNSTIVNRTRKGRLRVRLEVGVDYAVDPERAEEVAKEAITDLEEVMSVPRPQVVPTGFGDSAIDLELRFWIDKPSARRRWRARAAALRSVYAAFEAADIKIPYPQRELSGRAETGGFRVAREATPEEETPSKPAED
jgi:small-conductance mechanosensitive channel